MHATEADLIETRQERGTKIAATLQRQLDGECWTVPSQSGGQAYIVNPERGTCTCPDHRVRKVKCKHLWAVEHSVTHETDANGTTRVTKTTRVTYSQEWTAYNAAQTHEQDRFMELLRGLCEGVEQPVQTMGRPRLPLADVVYALGLRTYSMISGRRAMSAIRGAEADGFMVKAPHYNSAFRCLESDSLTDLLRRLIEESAQPLQAVEADFAIDSTGFATNTYSRWFDHKWGKVRSEQQWIKLHIMTGVTTNIVTAALATADESADAPQLPALLEKTAETFSISELSADKAYSSKRNLHTIQATGGTPYVPFKAGTNGNGRDMLWNRLWHFYSFNQQDFLAHYHKRSNVETTVSMIKAKFGGSVRAKLPTAQVNEVLLKVLCHNVVVLVQSIYELGLEPTFWTEPSCPKSPALASKVPMLTGF